MSQMTWSPPLLPAGWHQGGCLKKTCLCMPGLLLPFLLVSASGCSWKQGIMLGRLLEDPVLLFLCLKAISSADFEGQKVAFKRKTT